jgi:hypothetical protein
MSWQILRFVSLSLLLCLFSSEKAKTASIGSNSSDDREEAGQKKDPSLGRGKKESGELPLM